MKKTTPTASQIELLMSDWLLNLREQGSFVHMNTKGTISCKKGTNHSDYFMADMKDYDELDVLRHSREIAQGMVDSMTEIPVKVALGTSSSMTDGQQILLATDYFDSKNLSIGDKIDILTGFAIHEASHVNYTDMTALTEFINTFPVSQRSVVQCIQNILEDERIEYLTGEERPGLMGFVSSVKSYCWDEYAKGVKVMNEGITEPLPRFLNTLLAAVRFPTMLNEQDVMDNFQELKQIRDILTPYPLTTEGVLDATKKILKVMSDLIKEQMKNDEQNQQNQQQGNPSDASGSQNQQQGGSSAGPDQNQQSDQMKNLLDNIIKNVTSSNNPQKKAQCLQGASRGDRSYVNGDAEKTSCGAGSGRITYAYQIRGNETKYKNAYSRIKPYIPSIRKALTCKTETRDYVLRGEKSGRLNTNKLVQLRVGERNIFTRQGTVSCDRASVCILIDESGSMGCDRLSAAMETAVLIKESIKSIDNLDLYIYGFGGHDLKVYEENGKSNRWALGALDDYGGTPTGDAMNIAYKRMSRNPNPAALMLVITDGDPDRPEIVMEADKNLRKKGIIPVGIGIAGCTGVKQIFQDSIVIDDLSTLAPELGKITKKRLMRLLERHDSLA